MREGMYSIVIALAMTVLAMAFSPVSHAADVEGTLAAPAEHADGQHADGKHADGKHADGKHADDDAVTAAHLLVPAERDLEWQGFGFTVLVLLLIAAGVALGPYTIELLKKEAAKASTGQ